MFTVYGLQFTGFVYSLRFTVYGFSLQFTVYSLQMITSIGRKTHDNIPSCLTLMTFSNGLPESYALTPCSNGFSNALHLWLF